MRHDMNTGACERSCSSMRQWCACTVSSAGPFDLPFVCHIDEAAYVSCLYALFRKYLEKSTEEEGFDWLSLCCIDAPYDRFYLICNAASWWRDLYFERWKRLNEKGRRFVGWHNLVMFAIPPRERDLFRQAVKEVWVECESFCTLGVPTPVYFVFMTDQAHSGTSLERDLVQKVAEDEYHVTMLGAFLRYVRYVPFEGYAYLRTAPGCEGGGALL